MNGSILHGVYGGEGAPSPTYKQTPNKNQHKKEAETIVFYSEKKTM